ncbi:MAG: hypothetical protein KZQ73_14535, partial [Candidatus Thiodiazotropha sp. (ex Semelilucina semeliformis)]|nr:hypothetical protein [Candidatus Thiodiazotropha sp. (ex Semelilucina semeliformis)]
MLLFDEVGHAGKNKMTDGAENENNDTQVMNKAKTDYIHLKDADTLDGVFLERVRRSADKTAFVQYDEAQSKWQEIT